MKDVSDSANNEICCLGEVAASSSTMYSRVLACLKFPALGARRIAISGPGGIGVTGEDAVSDTQADVSDPSPKSAMSATIVAYLESLAASAVII